MELWELDTPCLIINLDKFEKNIKRMSRYCKENKINLRPHIKTHKVPEIAKMQVESGAIGITSAKVTEADVMVNAGLKDILIAYPVYGEPKLNKLINLAESTNITVALDSEIVAEGISKKAQERGKQISILLEVDVGMRRCGWELGEEFIKSSKRINDMKGVKVQGIMFYPGYISSVMPDNSEVGKLLKKLQEDIDKAYDVFKSLGIKINVFSGGSTPTAFLSHRLKGVTEIRPGTYVFNDLNVVGSGAVTEEDCALFVLTTVVSTTVKGKMMLDAGSKTMSSDPLKAKNGRGFGKICGYEDLFIEKMNEEHGYVDISKSDKKFKVGDKLLVIPNHACTTVNMHNEVYGIRNNKVELCWQISARGKVR